MEGKKGVVGSSIAGCSCKEWPFLKDKDGYGVVKILGKMRKAHRVAKEIDLGRKLRSEEIIMHQCDNPSCINPEHLIMGNTKDNNAQARNKKMTQADLALPGWEFIYKNGSGDGDGYG